MRLTLPPCNIAITWQLYNTCGTLVALHYRESDGAQVLELRLSGSEKSDFINFVLKEGDSWFDNKGTNFHVPLQSDTSSAEATVPIPEPPTELCGVWAYIKWENDGCPNRPGHEADAEYQLAIQVLCPSLPPHPPPLINRQADVLERVNYRSSRRHFWVLPSSAQDSLALDSESDE